MQQSGLSSEFTIISQIYIMQPLTEIPAMNSCRLSMRHAAITDVVTRVAKAMITQDIHIIFVKFLMTGDLHH